MIAANIQRSCFVTLIVLALSQILIAQEKPKVFFSDDFRLESSTPAYLWFYDQKGILEKVHEIDGEAVEIVKAFAKNCECTVLKEPDDANYVILVSRYDMVFRPKLAEKKFVVIKVDGEKLVFKGSVRRASNIASDSCKAIMRDWKRP
jgi:phosphoribosyl-ATP pyrophosphohydrolase